MADESNDYIQQLTTGKLGLHRLPRDWDEYRKARVRLAAVACMVDNQGLVKKVGENGVVGAAAGKNAEQMIGELTVPLSVVGPLRLKNHQKEYWVPLSTTEGALVASVQRGVKAITLSGGADVVVEDRGMTRAPVFAVSHLREAEKFILWLKSHQQILREITENTSRYLSLVSVEPEILGRNVYVRFRFTTGEAMGMNMVTIATQAAVAFIEVEFGIACIALSGNACVDKKPAWSNVLLGRGLKVQAEVIMSRDLVTERLKTSPEKIVEVVMRKDWLGSAVSGSMGFNGHFANVIAGLFLATGQDMAHVVEGSLGITTAELHGDELYFSVNLPTVVVGTVGGGTQLPVQKAALEIMGLGNGAKGEKAVFGEIIGATVLAGELSLTAALAAGQLATAHQRLGRRSL
jgi:hydroxymethylglutaryl-CoA reductase (NADPH)